MMAIERLDHVNILTGAVDAMAAFYQRVLGLERGFRPDFDNSGAWLYCDERAIVHLVDDVAPAQHDGRIEHFALGGSDYEAFMRTLAEEGIASWETRVPDSDIVQVNLRDPDGNHIEVLFDYPEPPG